MKLLLTSAGLTNNTIISTMEKLLGKSAKGVKLVFIPTAANVEEGDKSWMNEDIENCRRAGFDVEIVDICIVPQSEWLPTFEAAEVLFFGGGNTFHLMRWVSKSGLQDLLPKLLETRIYAGISAGSCIAGPTIYNSVQNLIGETYELKIKQGLGLVNFQVIPHLNSPYFPSIREENLVQKSKDLAEPVYAIDDQSAILVHDDHIEVVSEGTWHKFN